MRYGLIFWVLLVSSAAADTCVVSGQMVACDDGAKYIQHGDVISVTPGGTEMAELGYIHGSGDAAAAAAAIDSLGGYLTAQEQARAQRYGEGLRDAQHRRTLEQDQYQFDKKLGEIDKPMADSSIKRDRAQEEQARGELQLRGVEVENTGRYQQGMLGNAQTQTRNQNEQFYHGQNNESAAARAVREQQNDQFNRTEDRALKGDINAQYDQELGGLDNYVKSMQDIKALHADNPMKYNRQVMDSTNTLLYNNPRIAGTFFGDRASGMRVVGTSDGRLIPTAMVDGKRVTLDNNGEVVPFDSSNTAGYRAVSGDDLIGIAQTRATLVQGNMSSGAAEKQRAEQIAAETARAKREAEQNAALGRPGANTPIQQLATGAAQEEVKAKVTGPAKERHTAALEGLSAAITNPINDELKRNAAWQKGNPGVAEELLLDRRSTLNIPDKQLRQYQDMHPSDNLGTPGAAAQHYITKHYKAIVGDQKTMNYLREVGLPIPPGEPEDWTPEQQTQVNGLMAKALVGLVGEKGLQVFEDGIQKDEIAAMKKHAVVDKPIDTYGYKPGDGVRGFFDVPAKWNQGLRGAGF